MGKAARHHHTGCYERAQDGQTTTSDGVKEEMQIGGEKWLQRKSMWAGKCRGDQKLCERKPDERKDSDEHQRKGDSGRGK